MIMSNGKSTFTPGPLKVKVDTLEQQLEALTHRVTAIEANLAATYNHNLPPAPQVVEVPLPKIDTDDWREHSSIEVSGRVIAYVRRYPQCTLEEDEDGAKAISAVMLRESRKVVAWEKINRMIEDNRAERAKWL